MYRRSRTESCGAIILKWHSNAFSSERVFTMQRRSWTAQRHFTCNSQTVKCPMKLQGHSDSEHLELKMGKSLICCLKVEIVFDLFKFYIVRQEWKETIRLCFSVSWYFQTKAEPQCFWHSKNKYDRAALRFTTYINPIRWLRGGSWQKKKEGFLCQQSNPQAPLMCDAFLLPMADKSDIIILTIRIQWQHSRFHPSN